MVFGSPLFPSKIDWGRIPTDPGPHKLRDRAIRYSTVGSCWRFLGTLTPETNVQTIYPINTHYTRCIWVFPKIMVPPNHPILIGFSMINHPFGGTPIFGNTHMGWLLRVPNHKARWHCAAGSSSITGGERVKKISYWKAGFISQKRSLYSGTTPHPVTVTTRIISFLVGNPYKPSFVTVTGWGVDRTEVILPTQNNANHLKLPYHVHFLIPTMWLI